jgi:hypothetical protein
MLHDLPPHQQYLSASWQKELDRLFSALAKNHQIAALEEIIQTPVMKRAGK